jgi:hypothetical protein
MLGKARWFLHAEMSMLDTGLWNFEIGWLTQPGLQLCSEKFLQDFP